MREDRGTYQKLVVVEVVVVSSHTTTTVIVSYSHGISIAIWCGVKFGTYDKNMGEVWFMSKKCNKVFKGQNIFALI